MSGGLVFLDELTPLTLLAVFVALVLVANLVYYVVNAYRTGNYRKVRFKK